MENDNKSIIKEALTDYNTIMEAADANAKKKLADEFPDKFKNLLKEEINKNKKSVKESYKKVDDDEESENDETESNNESVMEKKVKETKKVEEAAGKDGVFTEKAKKVEKVEEDVKITDTVGKGDPFKDKAKKVQKVEETVGDGKPFAQKANKPLQTEEFDITELDMSSVDSALEVADDEDEVLTMEEIEREISNMEGLGEELKGIESSSPSYMEKGNKGVAFDQLINMRNQLDEMINSMGTDEVDEGLLGNITKGIKNAVTSGKQQVATGLQSINPQNLDAQADAKLNDLMNIAFEAKLSSTTGGAVKKTIPFTPAEIKLQILQQYLQKGGSGSLGLTRNPETQKPMVSYKPESEVNYASTTAPVVTGQGGMAQNEMHQAGGETFGSESQINRLHNNGPTTELIDEVEDDTVSDDEIEALLGEPNDEEIDETMSISYSAGTITPGKLGDHEGTHGRFRNNQNESNTKIGSLINENKNLTKKLNESKKYKNTVSTLLEQYKTALEKYRTQLKEMAVFNTNLAHVNNLLVNEELALTQDDKIKIINEFKKVDSITSSQNKYKTFLTEMRDSRKTLTESVEDKVTTSIQPSSKQTLDEVIEKTAYADNKHIQKMKSLIEYVENRGKKIIN